MKNTILHTKNTQEETQSNTSDSTHEISNSFQSNNSEKQEVNTVEVLPPEETSMQRYTKISHSGIRSIDTDMVHCTESQVVMKTKVRTFSGNEFSGIGISKIKEEYSEEQIQRCYDRAAEKSIIKAFQSACKIEQVNKLLPPKEIDTKPRTVLNPDKKMTETQLNYLNDLMQKIDTFDSSELCQDTFHKPLTQLTCGEASKFIDILKEEKEKHRKNPRYEYAEFG